MEAKISPIHDQVTKNYQLSGNFIEVVRYPDPILKKVAKEIIEFDDNLQKLATDMLYTMYKSPGIGLAAPQIAESLRMFVIDVNYKRESITHPDGTHGTQLLGFDPYVFINPVIVETEGEKMNEEGCLSLPGVFEEIKRYEKIKVEFQNTQGEKQSVEADGLFSICIQHELDHLNGKVFIDHLSPFKKAFYKKRLLKEKKKLQ